LRVYGDDTKRRGSGDGDGDGDGGAVCVGKKKECRPPIQEISDANNLSCQCQQTRRAALRDVIMSNVNLACLGDNKRIFEMDMDRI
jgi:hypothetical protein